MLKQSIHRRLCSLVLALSLGLSLVSAAIVPISATGALSTGTDGVLDIVVNKPVSASVYHDPATINIDLPYGTLYQMLNVAAHPDAEATLYRSDGTTVIPFAGSGINLGDAKLDQFSPSGTTSYTLVVADKNNGANTRRYAITVTVEQQLPAYAGPIESGETFLPLNIAGGEHAWDVMGASRIGNGSTTGSVEGPTSPSSYSGKAWSESVYDRAGDYPAATAVDESWIGDNMYLQTIGRDDPEALAKYGIASAPGGSLLNSDILRFHAFKPFVAPDGVGRDDGDRGAVGSDRQRLEIKSSTSGSNAVANSKGGEIMTHHWKLMLPSETLRFQHATSDDQAGDYIIPRRFWHIFQLKEIQGNAAGQPVTTLSLVSYDDNGTPKGHLEFRNNPDGSSADRIKPLFQIPFERIENRWLDFEVTILTADRGYVHAKLVDVETGEVLFQGGMTAETFRRPEVTNPATGKLERGDMPAEPGQQNRSKWGLYRGMYNGAGDVGYADEFQSATMYLSDIYLVNRDESSYVFPDGWDPKAQTKEVVAWARPLPVSAPQGTTFEALPLPSQLDFTLSSGETTKANVVWEADGFDSGTVGSYTVYGDIQGDGSGIDNPRGIRPFIQVNVTEREGEYRNWSSAPGSEIKVVSKGNNKPFFIDDDPSTYWITNSSLITPDAGDRQYWASVKLPQKIDVERIELEWTNNSNYLNNYQIYYSNDAAAYDELIEGNNFSTSQTGTTKPLLTPNGGSWNPIPEAGKSSPLDVNQQAAHILDEPVSAQYLLLVSDVNQGRPSGAGYGLRSNEFRIFGAPSGADVPEESDLVDLLDPATFAPQDGINVKASSEAEGHSGTDALKQNGTGYWRNSSPNVYREAFGPSSLTLSIDLGAPKTVEKLYLELPNGITNIQQNARRFEVYYSNEPDSWASAPTPTDEAVDYDWQANGWTLAGGTETEGLWSSVAYDGQEWGYDTKTFLYPFTARYVMIHLILTGPSDRRTDDAASMMGISGLKIYGKEPVANGITLEPSKTTYSTWDQEEPVSTAFSLADGQPLTRILNDGTELQPDADYMHQDGKVTIAPAYLASLPHGTNELTLEFGDGRASIFAIDVTARGHGNDSRTIRMNAIDGVSPYNVLGAAMGTDEPVEGVTKRIRDGYHAFYGDSPQASAADDHILSVWDDKLQKQVFQIIAHGRGLNNEFLDKVRDGEYAHKGVFDPGVGHVVGGAAYNDRQRIEIRPSEDSNGDFVAYEGDIVSYEWMWNIPDGEQWNQPNFRHLFQLKATNAQGKDTLAGGNNGGENGAYILAMSITGRDKRDLIVNHNRHDGDKALMRIPLSELNGHWLKVELNALVSDAGWLTIRITDTETGKVYAFDSPDVYQVFPAQGAGDGVKDLWRRPTRDGNFETEHPAVFDQYLRPKWGIYRSSNGGTNSAYDAELKLADITIRKVATGISSVNLALGKKAYNVGPRDEANAVQLAAATANIYGGADKLTNGVLEDPVKWAVDNVDSLNGIGGYSWLGTDGARKGSFVIDLGEAMDFSQIRLFAKSTRLKGVNIYVTADDGDYDSAPELEQLIYTKIVGPSGNGYTYETGNTEGGTDAEDRSYPIDLGKTYHARYIKVTAENASGGNAGTDLTGPPRLTQAQVFNAPPPPQHLIAEVGGADTVLKWSASAASDGFLVYDGTTLLAELPGSSTSYLLPEQVEELSGITVRSIGTDLYSRKRMVSAPSVPTERQLPTNPNQGTVGTTNPVDPGVSDGVIDLNREASTTISTTSDGKKRTRVTVHANHLEKALAHDIVTIELTEPDSSLEVDLPGGPLLQAVKLGSKSVIRIISGDVTYELPVALFSGVSSDGMVKASIAPIAGAEGAALNDALREYNAEPLLPNPISFEISVNGKVLKDFGGTYVLRTIRLGDTVIEPDRSTAVWIDGNGGIHFVPTVFDEKDGIVYAAIYAPHDGTYALIESDLAYADLIGHWGETDVLLLANKRIVSGKTTEMFAPEDPITRAEFVALVVRTLSLMDKTTVAFSDVSLKDWFAGSVGAAVQAGLVTGYKDGTFQPEATITREQMAAILVRALAFAGFDADSSDASPNASISFSDEGSIAEWAKEAVQQAVFAGIATGFPNGEFAPGEEASRAQAVAMLKRMLAVLKFID